MKRMTVWLSAFMALVLTVAGAVPAAGQGDQPGEPGNVPDGLSATGWQVIQDQVAKLAAADGSPYDEFGLSVSVDGDTAVVGAHLAVVGGHAGQGAAYVFYRNQGGPDAWDQVAKLAAAGGFAGDNFGVSVSVDGDTAVVGAFLATVGGRVYQGAAYVFYRNQGGPDAWGQVAKLTPSQGRASDHFGRSVSLSGDTVLVGADWVKVGDNPKQGAAYIFYRNQGGPNAWGQVVKLIAADGRQKDYFGTSVALDGDTAIVGASQANVGPYVNQGAAYVFYRDQGGANAWGQVAKLKAADGIQHFCFASSLTLDGDTAVAGASFGEGNCYYTPCAAYVFYRNEGGPDAWGQVAKLDSNGDPQRGGFGASVSLDGDTLLVGAPLATVGGNTLEGAAYVFGRSEGGPDAWGQIAELTASDGAEYDYLGIGVSLSGDTALVGAPWADVGGNSDQGAAYVYRLDTTLHLRALLLDWTYGTQPGTYRVSATLRVHDQNEAPAPEVAVYGDWTLADGSIRHRTAVTDPTGRAKLTMWVTHAGSYQFCVTDLAKAGYAYDPGANEVPACGSVVVGP